MTQLSTHSYKRIPLALSPIHAGPAAEMGHDYKWIDLNEIFTGGREGFRLFEVTGDSQAPVILPGYFVIVDTWREPQHGDFIAAEVDGLTCVKVFQRTTNGLYLASKNGAKYTPREITEQNSFRVLGVVTGHLARHKRW